MGSLVEDLSLPADSLVGLSGQEVQDVAADQGVATLPARYVEFLSEMGRKAGGLLAGTDAFYPEILGLRRDAMELLAENGESGLLRDESVVFAMHQGYQVYWMASRILGDPPVFMYQEGHPGVARERESLTAFLQYESLKSQ
jgi:hypothetical protein